VTNGKEDGIYGANFSCKISPWLAFGCISPRSMFAELKGTATSEGVNGLSNSGNSWLMYELLWRDFFRFVTKKYSSPTKQLQSTPDAALAGALA
ncbi:hypothetical protein, partial [Streptomyces fildesensis]|uniref:hypothetical protein n=1 Tax=Streptomyces fildesensis TaxID=375757 RepID=UPI001E5810BB